MNAHNLEQQMDHDIDRVLQALSGPPPERVAQRVLAALAQRQAAVAATVPPRNPWSPVSRLSWPLRVTTITSILAVLIVAASAYFSRGHKEHVDVATASSPSETQFAATAHPSPTNAAPTMLIRPVRAPRHRTPALTSSPTATPAVALDPATCHCDPVALAEASAPSRPAPPVPLTREERHMLMLVSSGEPQQLAVLDPNLRDLEFQRVRADFNRFFAPRPAEANTSTTSGNTSKQGNDQP